MQQQRSEVASTDYFCLIISSPFWFHCTTPPTSAARDKSPVAGPLYNRQPMLWQELFIIDAASDTWNDTSFIIHRIHDMFDQHHLQTAAAPRWCTVYISRRLSTYQCPTSKFKPLSSMSLNWISSHLSSELIIKYSSYNFSSYIRITNNTSQVYINMCIVRQCSLISS